MRWIIWFLAVAFYYYEFLLRVFPSVMVQELMEAFSISALMIGNLSAFYFYAYAPMQLPVGILTDRYGARNLLTFASLGCGLATIMFAFTHNIWVAQIARFIIGAGSAFGFVGMIYISSHWFSRKKLALLIGVGNSLGMLGAVSGQGPLRELIDVFQWRDTLFYFGVAGLVLGALIYFLVKNDPPKTKKQKKETHENLKDIIKGFIIVCKNPQTWVIALAAFFFYTVTTSFAALWSVPYIRTVYQVDDATAGYAGSMVFLGWIVGGPIIGYFSDKLKRRKPFLLVSTIAAAIMFISILFFTKSLAWAFVELFVLGLFLSAQLLTYSLAIESNPATVKGTAVALTNFIVFFEGSLMQPFVGYLLDLNWSGEMKDGIPLYDKGDFQLALSSFIVMLLVAFIFALFIKRPKPNRIHQEIPETTTPEN
ncbi:MAG: hypothetical protein COT84_04325 [Chlamydiae bacterium CG10_big_fil_rev_8_21_14_0_10_35_9]|nr:MAG: hypothetical protein COT84_04325 [Chlamydiae bacterium CG10_big_fil_rev_8_21_14_0_10_35_9]